MLKVFFSAQLGLAYWAIEADFANDNEAVLVADAIITLHQRLVKQFVEEEAKHGHIADG